MTMFRRRLVLPAVLGTLAAATVGLAVSRSGDGARPGQIVPYEDAAAVARGEALYAAHCAACHGAEREGQTADWRVPGPGGLLPAPPHDETGHTWHHPDALLIDITARGTEAVVGGGYRSAMIGFGDLLSDAEILAVLAFIKNAWPADIIEVHNRVNAEAARFAD
jgi:mono/diheme cytochrome c family protein